jgi:dTDP-4-amino-4,6-dideoxygalactose transaminase
LDEWDQTRNEWSDAANAYRRALGGSNRVRLQHGFGETWISSTCVLSFAQPAADRIEQSLADNGIETRRWWSTGAHTHPATASFPRTAMPVTDALVRSTLAVPFYRDINAAEISRVAKVVLAAAEAGCQSRGSKIASGPRTARGTDR